MEYVMLKYDKKDYLIVKESEWNEFTKNKDSIPKKDQKDRSYRIRDKVFLIKEANKIKKVHSGTLTDMYRTMKEDVLKYADYRELTDDILEYLEDNPNRKNAYIEYFAKEFTNEGSDRSEYDYNYEAVRKYDYLKMFENDDVLAFSDSEYRMLVEIALKAKHDDKNKAINAILSCKKFVVPEGFNMFYSDEMEFDEKLKYIKNRDIIYDYFMNNRRGMHRFLIRPNEYTPYVVMALEDINPIIYTYDEKLEKKHFLDLFSDRHDKDTMGAVEVLSASNGVVMTFSKIVSELYDREMEDVFKDEEAVAKAYEEYLRYTKVILDGIKNVPEVFGRSTCKRILDLFSQAIKGESNKSQKINILNDVIKTFECGSYNESTLQNIFSDWCEVSSIDFKNTLKYISDENIERIKKYVSQVEINYIEANR